jgi:tryptophan-rich sensory protein
MICGNPRAGRTMATLGIAVLLLVLSSMAVIALRKRYNPLRQPPLHPATFVVQGKVRG